MPDNAVALLCDDQFLVDAIAARRLRRGLRQQGDVLGDDARLKT